MKTCKKCSKQIKDGEGRGYSGNVCKQCIARQAREWYDGLPELGDMMPITVPGCPGGKIETIKRVMRWDKYLEQESERYKANGRKAEIREMFIKERKQLVLFVDCVAPCDKLMRRHRKKQLESTLCA